MLIFALAVLLLLKVCVDEDYFRDPNNVWVSMPQNLNTRLDIGERCEQS